MKTLEAGKLYEAMDSAYDPIRIESRTAKMATIHAENGLGRKTSSTWRTRIRTDADGYEYVVDTAVSKKWRDVFTWSARNPWGVEPSQDNLFFLIDEVKGGDLWTYVLHEKSKAEAVDFAQSMWDHMTDYDKSRRSSFWLGFGPGEDDMPDVPKIDWLDVVWEAT